MRKEERRKKCQEKSYGLCIMRSKVVYRTFFEMYHPFCWLDFNCSALNVLGSKSFIERDQMVGAHEKRFIAYMKPKEHFDPKTNKQTQIKQRTKILCPKRLVENGTIDALLVV